jgi:hypothetical protein
MNQTLALAWQRAADEARDRASQFRQVFDRQGDLLFLARVLPSVLFLLLTVAVLVATRMHALESARSLEFARASLNDARATARHLEVERSLLRSPARLKEVAAGMGLTAPETVVHLGPTPRDRVVDADEGGAP